jgi:Tol biopolymer transport system component
MDAQVFIDGVDVSQYLRSITRNYNYCSISQEFSIELDISYATDILTYNDVVIYEEGVKVLTGYVASITKSVPGATIKVNGSDVLRRAVDYFIPDTYTTVAGQTTNYWLTFILGLCGLSTIVYTDGIGPHVPPAQELGMDSAVSLITYLLQYSGWYIRADENGGIIIGKISTTPTGEQIIQGNDVIEMELERSYDKTRNKAVVFGGVEVDFTGFHQITAVSRVDNPFSDTDQTVVIGNPLIGDQDSANKFADELVNAFKNPTVIKKYKILGNPHLKAGTYIEVTSDNFSGFALLSSLETSFDDNGYVMNATLDDFCPRIIASVRGQADLYAGTNGAGVWQYSLFDATWTNISAGLTNLHINDLSEDSGLFITSTPAGLYTKIGSHNWVYQNIPLYSGYTDGTLQYPAVYANASGPQVHAIVTLAGTVTNREWFYTGTVASGGGAFHWSGCPVFESYIDASGVLIASGNEVDFGYDLEGYYGSKFIVDLNGKLIEAKFSFTNNIHSTSDIGVSDTTGIDKSILMNLSDSNDLDNSELNNSLSKLVLSINKGSGQHIYTANADGTNQVKLTSININVDPGWSFDDTKIVFVRSNGSYSNLYTMNADGSNQTNITNQVTELFYATPKWGPNNKIIYSRTYSSYTHIFSINPDGTGETQLTTGSSYNQYPSYSIDGNSIYFSSTRDEGVFDAYHMNLDGSGVTRDTFLSGGGRWPQQLENGDIICSNESQVYEVVPGALSGSVTTQDLLDAATFSDGSQDWVICSREYFPTVIGLFKVDPSTGSITNLGGSYAELSSSRDHKVITMVDFSDGNSDIYSPGYNSGPLKIAKYDGSVGSISITGHEKWGKFSPHPNKDGSKIVLGMTNPEVLEWKNIVIDINGNILYTEVIQNPGDNDSFFGPNDDVVTSFNSNVYVNGTLTYAGYDGYLDYDTQGRLYIYKNGSSGGIWRDDHGSITQIVSLSANFVRVTNGITLDGNYLLYGRHSGDASTAINYTLLNIYTLKGFSISTSSATVYADIATNIGYLYWIKNKTGTTFGIFNPGPLNKALIRRAIVDGEKPFYRKSPSKPLVRVMRTDDNSTFTKLYQTVTDYREVNVDTYSPLSVYGPSGLNYATDFLTFSGILSTGEVFDVATRMVNNDASIFMTTGSGIYRTLISGIPQRMNSVAATEIVARTLGSGEIFFSVGGTCKRSINDCATYTDISSGLPGETITVLRLKK